LPLAGNKDSVYNGFIKEDMLDKNAQSHFNEKRRNVFEKAIPQVDCDTSTKEEDCEPGLLLKVQ